MNRILYGIIVLGGTVLGVTLAYLVDPEELREVPGFTGYTDPRFLLAILLGGLGYLVTATLTWELEQWIEKQLPYLKLKDVVIGAAGLLFGITVPALVLVPLYWFVSSHPFVKTTRPEILTLGVLILPIVMFLFGYLGMTVFLRKSSELLHLLGGQPTVSPRILDTSVIIDGRILDVIRSMIIEGPVVLPEYVLSELHHISDSADPIKRARGKRGFEILEGLKACRNIELAIFPDQHPGIQEVDAKLVQLTKDTRGTLFTLDANLHKVASIQGAKSVNLNEVGNALRPALMPGDRVEIQLVKKGKERRQAVGYLNDGSMVVVEEAEGRMGQSCWVMVSSVLKTSAGRMIFARLGDPDDGKHVGAEGESVSDKKIGIEIVK